MCIIHYTVVSDVHSLFHDYTLSMTMHALDFVGIRVVRAKFLLSRLLFIVVIHTPKLVASDHELEVDEV